MNTVSEKLVVKLCEYRDIKYVQLPDQLPPTWTVIPLRKRYPDYDPDLLLITDCDADAHEPNCKGDGLVTWALVECQSWKEGGIPDEYSLLAEGYGPSSNLRECRHTYFYPLDEGYGYYIYADSFIKLFEALKKWFDFE